MASGRNGASGRSGAASRAGIAGRAGAALGRSLPLAIASGVVLAAVFIGTLLWSPWAFLTFVAVIIVLALFELDAAFRIRGLRPATPAAVAAGLVAFYGSYAAGPAAQTLGLVLLLLGTLAWALFDPGRSESPRDRAAEAADAAESLSAPEEEDAAGIARPAVPRIGSEPGGLGGNVGATCLMTLWVPFMASFIGLLLARDEGTWAVMATVALAVTNDIGAYAFGNRFGKARLAPSVSPGKSWEGLAGGLVTTLVIAAVGTSRVPGFDMPLALALAVGVVVAGTLGDLAESLVKRDLGVKDLGRMIPGHGGIMDRVDALLFALPTGHLVLVAFGV